jgi:hypothetical protein
MLGAEASASIITRDLVREAAAGLALKPPAGSNRRRATRWVMFALAAVLLAALAAVAFRAA